MRRSLKDIIRIAKTFESDELSLEEINILIEETLNLKPYQILLQKDEEFEDEILIERLEKARKIPSAYLLNKKRFLTRDFWVDKNVLIPRDETEELVQLVIHYIENNNYHDLTLIDVGTGSGCIAISLKAELSKKNQNINVIATDISEKALEIANKNSIIHNQTIQFIKTSCLENIDLDINIIVSNPPYISYNSFVSERVLRNEPHTALFADEQGTKIYHQILKDCYKFKNLKAIFVEMSPEQEETLRHLGETYLPNFKFNSYYDMNGFIRFVSFIKIEE